MGGASRRTGAADVVEGRLAGQPVVLAKPRSYMNESGGPIVAVSRFFKVGVERIVVVHDELDLPFGALRLKRGGGEGGHNGLRSTSAALGSKDYLRVRFGIGRPPGRQDPADYVLREFAAAERKELGRAVRPGRRRGGGGAGQGPGGGPERVPLLTRSAPVQALFALGLPTRGALSRPDAGRCDTVSAGPTGMTGCTAQHTA